jgi:hypothetical protein
MANQRLDARYSALGLISRVGFCLGLAVAFWFFASYIKGADWFAAICYVAAVGMTSATLGFFYLLLAASGRVVVSIDATGFKDTRVTPALIPWSAIESVSPYVPYKSRSPAGVEVVIGPAFRQEISIRLGARLFAGASFLWRRAIRLDTRILDVDCNEISRIANCYLSKRS